METKKTFATVIATALISSFFTYQYAQLSISAHREAPMESVMSDDSFENPGLSRTISTCSQPKNHNLAHTPQNNIEPEGIQNQPIADKQLSRKPKPEQGTGTEPSKKMRQRIKQQEEYISGFRKRLSDSSGKEAKELVQRNYDSEKLDYEWANQQEEELLSIFDNEESLQSMAPLDLSCKSENCQIILPAADSTQVGSMYQSVLEAVSRTDEATEKNVSYFTDDEKGQLIIYVSDQGNMSLFE